jgi:hypothetical protein
VYWSVLLLSVPGPDPAEVTTPVIAVELRTSTPVVKKGEVPQFVVEVVNQSDKDIILVQAGDGSDIGWRTPIARWEVEGVKPRKVPRCGNTNPLTADEVVTLKPRQRLKLGEWVRPLVLPGPGRYKVRFCYENKPDLKWSGVPLGRHDVKAMARVRASTPAAAYSNTVVVEVK